jgi:hypothetical protein
MSRHVLDGKPITVNHPNFPLTKWRLRKIGMQGRSGHRRPGYTAVIEGEAKGLMSPPASWPVKPPCLLLARNRPGAMSALQPLSGGKGTHCGHIATAVFDPNRTLARQRAGTPAISFDHLVGAGERREASRLARRRRKRLIDSRSADALRTRSWLRLTRHTQPGAMLRSIRAPKPRSRGPPRGPPRRKYHATPVS